MIEHVARGGIYHVYETEIIGNEQEGGRPAIVVSNNTGNTYAPIVEIVYLTTKGKKAAADARCDQLIVETVNGVVRADHHGR